jgi:hypothetical protein
LGKHLLVEQSECDHQEGSANPGAIAEALAVLERLPPEEVCLLAEAAVLAAGSRWLARTEGGAEEVPGEGPKDSQEAGGDGDGGGAGDDGGEAVAAVVASLVEVLVWSEMGLLARDSGEGPAAMGSAGLSTIEGLAKVRTQRREVHAGRGGGSGLWIHGSALG